MKTFQFIRISAVVIIFAFNLHAFAQGTAFTYQGRLNQTGVPAAGTYDLRLAIYDAAVAGTQQGGAITNSGAVISNGLFTVQMDFGANIFTGASRWLEIGVRTNGTGTFTTLTPRQPITPTPYAVTAQNLAAALGNNNVYGGVSSTLSGGAQNTATGDFATVAGGAQNAATGNLTVIGGGGGNSCPVLYGTIAGGSGNQAGSYSFVGGGEFNFATGVYASIPGGNENRATGNSSFAAGLYAWAQHLGTFVWADSSEPVPFSSTAANQFLIRATGGVGIGTTNPAAQLHVNGVGETLVLGGNPHAGGFTALSLGTSAATSGYGWVQAIKDSGTNYGNLVLNENGGRVGIAQNNPASALDVNGTVTCVSLNQTSDRNLKQDFAAISAAEILSKVTALPVSQWSYQADPATRHIGPMAQDFHAAFAIGTDDKHIATVDEGGVALAAIQGLNQKLEVRSLEFGDKSRKAEDRIQQLESENKELKVRLEKLERLMHSMSEKL